MDVRIANTEDPDRTASRVCAVCIKGVLAANFIYIVLTVFEILEHLL